MTFFFFLLLALSIGGVTRLVLRLSGDGYTRAQWMALMLMMLSVMLTFLMLPVLVLGPASMLVGASAVLRFRRQAIPIYRRQRWISLTVNSIPLLACTAVFLLQLWLINLPPH